MCFMSGEKNAFMVSMRVSVAEAPNFQVSWKVDAHLSDEKES